MKQIGPLHAECRTEQGLQTEVKIRSGAAKVAFQRAGDHAAGQETQRS